MSEELITIPGKRYRTINSCLAAYFDCKVKELDALEGNFHTRRADGTDVVWPIQDALAAIKKAKVWGWVEEKEFIHYFVRKSATMLDLMGLFSHELAHVQRPYHRSVEEERKAEKYSQVACAAYQIAKQVFEEIKE